jgi:hypothetical protein
MPYRLLADIVVALHVGYVACVVLGLVLILVGKTRGWRWVTNRWFRTIHLIMIVGVVIRALIWAECPLTWWERDLRELAHQSDFEGSPVGRVLHDLIHPDPEKVPLWVYPPIYAAFGLLILSTFWLVPVNWRPGRKAEPAGGQAG